MMLTQACRRWSRDILLAFNSGHRCKPKRAVCDLISRLSLNRPARGCRAGNHCRLRLQAAHTANSALRHGPTPTDILTIVGNRIQHQLSHHDDRDVRRSALRRVHYRSPYSVIRVGLFNARSVGNKCASIQQWISSRQLGVVGLVETWHDDMSSPHLIACAPAGYKSVEKARVRDNELSLSTNHGGVCLLYDCTLHARHVQLPHFASFEFVCSIVYRAGFNAVIVVIYRPGSQAVTQSFFNDLSDLLERLATYSSPLIIIGDFNIHVDDACNEDATKLHDILSTYDLQQHVKSPTHRQGHTLDLFITRTDLPVDMLPIGRRCCLIIHS